MKLIKNIIALLILFIFFGCLKTKETKKENQYNFVKGNEFAHPEDNKKVVILGESDDLRALNYFNLQDYSALFSINHIKKAKVDGGSLKLVLDSLPSSRLMLVAASSGNNFYKTKIFAIPGDTILFKIKNKKIFFYGKNAFLNGFYSELYSSTPEYYKNSYKNDMYSYKEVVDSIYNQKKLFFDNYIKINEITSIDFINVVKGDLKHEYLYELMTPRNKDAKVLEMYYGETDEFTSFIAKEFRSDIKLFDIKSYFNNISIEDFKDSLLLSNSVFFKDNLNQFIRYYFNFSTAEKFSKESFMAEKEFIEENLDGKIRNFAIARMINDYEKKGFGYSINNIKVLKSLMKEYESKFNNQSYKDEMNKINRSLDAFNFKLSDNALHMTKLISLTGDTLTLNEIFTRSTKRIRVIDFWASWCPPCIDEIKRVKDFKDKLSIEKDVEWIYLSIDKDQDKWVRTSQDLTKFLNVRNQYLILGGVNSSLTGSLKVRGIPRYVIFNTKNEIVLDNAPRPSDTIRFKKIINDISLRK